MSNNSAHSIVIALMFAVGVFGVVNLVRAGVSHSASGWAWGGGVSLNPAGYDGIGWLSFNSLTDGSPVDYGVNIPTSEGSISGYAWSEYYGWVSFNSADLAGCAALVGARREAGGAITGGARILAIANAIGNAGGYDGCILLNGVSVNVGDNTLDGYAWSSDLGWIDMGNISLGTPPPPAGTPSLVVCPTNPTISTISGTTQLRAYYRTSGLPITCDISTHNGSTDTDVTMISTWSDEPSQSRVVVSPSGLAQGVAVGDEAVTATYNPGTGSLSASRTVTVSCACTDEALHCVGPYINGCGASCVGTRNCPLVPQ